MAPVSLTMGIGAVATALARLIHPSEHIRRVYPNAPTTLRLSDLRIVCLDVKKIGKKDKEVVVFTSDEVKNENNELLELYAAKRFVKVLTEGPSGGFFNALPPKLPFDSGTESEAEELPSHIVALIKNGRNADAEDIKLIEGSVPIDDDRLPAPENIPTEDDEELSVEAVMGNKFGHSGVCNRQKEGASNMRAKLNFGNIKPT
jgi:hypothetical protein